MIGYNDLYELLRKEKYSEALQLLPKGFVKEFSDFLNEAKKEKKEEQGLLDSSDSGSKVFENAISLFKELILRRKKKILNLVFIATETGIMKRDYENMLEHEKGIFDEIVKIFEKGDKDLNKSLDGREEVLDEKKMVIFNESVDEFVGSDGEAIGPYASGELANLSGEIADILVQGNKASYVDE
jgi:DNA replication initiation complex subunit (GINS family)